MRQVVLAVMLMIISCGTRDPLAGVKKEHPGASEFLVWKNYLLIRYPVDQNTETQRAVILSRSGNGWVRMAESEQGFNSLREVITYIPEMDESGVAAWELR